MKKIIFRFSTTLLILLHAGSVFSQETITKVPKQISVEGGYRFVLPVIDRSAVPFVNSATNGYGFLVDYAWKLSGLNGKKPGIYLSVPIGYSVMLPDDNTSKRVSMLNYGWTVRHELSVNKPITPFLGYGLLLNTLKLDGTDGGVMGHQTQFEFGANLNTKNRLKYFAKLQYSYTSYPKLGDSKRIHFQYFDLRLGVRF
ncbi:MAG TPA: hypothetical protein VI413_01190 [Paludibacter sp.]